MQEAMKSGFMDAAGVDPARMKLVIAALVVSIIFLIAAWLGKQVLEAYGQGSLDSTEVVRIIFQLVIFIFTALGFVAFF